MAGAQLKHLEKIQAHLRDPASTRLSRDEKDALLALALYGQSKQDYRPFDYSHFVALIAKGGYRDFEWSVADVQRGLQKLGLEPNKKGDDD